MSDGVNDKNVTQSREAAKPQSKNGEAADNGRQEWRPYDVSDFLALCFKAFTFIVILFFLRTLTLPIHLYAQDDGSIAVTFDDVNVIAKKLYCPVCPNETLDACQTEACAQWRNEIATQLGEGQNEQQIIDSFVRRYGDRVVAIPQDEGLRALSLVTPYILAALALVVGGLTFLRWRRPNTAVLSTGGGSVSAMDDDYRARLERDLRE